MEFDMDDNTIEYFCEILREIKAELEAIHKLLKAKEQRETMFVHYMEGSSPQETKENENA